MTTDTTPLAPTDAELAALIDKEMREYSIGAYADHGSAKNQLEHFARAVLAKRGAQPIPQQGVQEPVEIPAKCPYFGPSPHRDVWLEGWYAACATKPAPQPVEREPAQWQRRHQLRTNGEWKNTDEHDAKWWRDNSQGWEIRALYTTPQPTQAQAGPISGAKSFQTYAEANAYSRGYYAGKKAAKQPQGGAVPLTDIRKAALDLYTPPFRHEYGYIRDANHQMVADDAGSEGTGLITSRIRGWGRIQYMDKPEQRAAALQDEVAEIVAEALNAYWSIHGIKGGQHGTE